MPFTLMHALLVWRVGCVFGKNWLALHQLLVVVHWEYYLVLVLLPFCGFFKKDSVFPHLPAV